MHNNLFNGNSGAHTAYRGVCSQILDTCCGLVAELGRDTGMGARCYAVSRTGHLQTNAAWKSSSVFSSRSATSRNNFSPMLRPSSVLTNRLACPNVSMPSTTLFRKKCRMFSVFRGIIETLLSERGDGKESNNRAVSSALPFLFAYVAFAGKHAPSAVAWLCNGAP